MITNFGCRMPAEFAKLTETQIRTLPRDRTVFFFAVGPLEDYGPHLPVGLGVAVATRHCQNLAERLESQMEGWKGILLPTAALGVDSHTTQLRLTVRPHVLRDWLVDSCLSLSKEGFRNFVCVSGILAPRQAAAIEDASKILWRSRPISSYKKRVKLFSASTPLIDFKAVKKAPFWTAPDEHGGARDTSQALALAASWVAPSFAHLAVQPPPADSPLGFGFKRLLGKVSGYWGDPAAADPEAGRTLLKSDTDTMWEALKTALELEKHPVRTFRSWYGVLWPNQSFFRAWVLAALLVGMVLLGFWVLSLSDFSVS